MEPLRDWSDLVIDTSRMTASDLQTEIRDRFRLPDGKMTVSLVSFGFSRGVPPNADLILTCRFLRNPHWDAELRPMTGLDQAVGDYVASDPAYDGAKGRIADLLRYLLPLYDAQNTSLCHDCLRLHRRAPQIGLCDRTICPAVAQRLLTQRKTSQSACKAG